MSLYRIASLSLPDFRELFETPELVSVSTCHCCGMVQVNSLRPLYHFGSRRELVRDPLTR
jgi:hypothetical protein